VSGDNIQVSDGNMQVSSNSMQMLAYQMKACQVISKIDINCHVTQYEKTVPI